MKKINRLFLYMLGKFDNKYNNNLRHLKKVELDKSLFPEELIQVFDEEINLKNNFFYGDSNGGVKTINLCFDNNNNSYLLLEAFNDFKLIVSKGDCYYDGITFYPMVNESRLLYNALFKYIDNDIDNIRYSGADTLTLFNYYCNRINNCIKKIDEYCISKDKEVIDSKTSSTIYFSNHEIDLSLSKGTKNSSSVSKTRVNKEIIIDKRMNILESFNFESKIEAKDLNYFDDYVVYYYPLANNEYRLVAEPISPIKATKVAYLKFNEDLSNVDLDAFTRDFLEIPASDFTLYSNVAKYNHTTFEVFLEKIKYILNQGGNIDYCSKKRINDVASKSSSTLVRK